MAKESHYPSSEHFTISENVIWTSFVFLWILPWQHCINVLLKMGEGRSGSPFEISAYSISYYWKKYKIMDFPWICGIFFCAAEEVMWAKGYRMRWGDLSMAESSVSERTRQGWQLPGCLLQKGFYRSAFPCPHGTKHISVWMCFHAATLYTTPFSGKSLNQNRISISM